MKFTEHRITSIILLSFLPLLATAQDIREIFRVPAGGIGEWKAGVAIEPKKKPKITVLGADGNIYIRDNGEWNNYPLQINSPDKQYLMNRKGELFIAARDGDMIGIWSSSDAGASWTRTGEYKAMQRPVFFATHADMKSGNIYLLFTTTEGEGDQCKSSVWMVNTSNGGKKWSDPVLLNREGASCLRMMASMASFKDGKLFTVWTDGQSFQVDRSYDGSTWLRNDISVTSDYKGQMEHGTPRLLMDNSDSQLQGMMYISGVSPSDSVSRVWIRKSGNLGDAWTPNVLIDKAYDGDQYFPFVTIDHEVGIMYAAWIGISGENAEVWFAWSLDAGQKFTAQKVSTWTIKPGEIDKWVQPVAVAAYDGTLFLTWLETSGGDVIQKGVEFSQKDLLGQTKK